jgi:hypothetical protein
MRRLPAREGAVGHRHIIVEGRQEFNNRRMGAADLPRIDCGGTLAGSAC